MYKYFVSYAFCERGGDGFANCMIETDEKVVDERTYRKMMDKVHERDKDKGTFITSNFILLGD